MLRKTMKVTWGILIEYYRANEAFNTQADDWQIKNFLIGEDGKKICSEQTYRKLKIGEATYHAETYQQLIHKLGFEEKELKIFEIQQLNQLFEELLHSIEYGKYELLKSLTNRILGILEPYSNYFLYSEYVELMNIIRDQYLHFKKMKQEHYEKYLVIYPVFVEPVRIIVKELVYRYCHQTFFDTLKLNAVSLQIKLEEETNDLLYCNRILQLMFNRRVINAYNTCLELRERLIKVQNSNLLASIDMVLISLCLNMKQNDVFIYFEELEALLEQPELSFTNAKKGRTYYSLGMQYFYQKRYERAYEMYSKAIALDPGSIQDAALYMRYMLELCDLPKINFALYPIKSCSERFQIIYRYYQLRDELKIANLRIAEEISYDQLKKLEMYINDHIMSQINGNNELLYEIFQEELDLIADRTKEYSIAQKFSIRYNKLKLVY